MQCNLTQVLRGRNVSEVVVKNCSSYQHYLEPKYFKPKNGKEILTFAIIMANTSYREGKEEESMRRR